MKDNWLQNNSRPKLWLGKTSADERFNLRKTSMHRFEPTYCKLEVGPSDDPWTQQFNNFIIKRKTIYRCNRNLNEGSMDGQVEPKNPSYKKFWNQYRKKLNFDFISFFVEFFSERFHILLSDNLILSGPNLEQGLRMGWTYFSQLSHVRGNLTDQIIRSLLCRLRVSWTLKYFVLSIRPVFIPNQGFPDCLILRYHERPL